MEKQTFTIPIRLTSLNEYINAERTNKYKAAKIKKEMTNICSLYCRNIKAIDKPFIMECEWGIGKHDPDNVAYAKKYVLDGLMKADKIRNDNYKYVKGFKDTFNKDIEGVIVTLRYL